MEDDEEAEGIYDELVVNRNLVVEGISGSFSAGLKLGIIECRGVNNTYICASECRESSCQCHCCLCQALHGGNAKASRAFVAY